MQRPNLLSRSLLPALLLLAAAQAGATTVLQMNLAELTQGAERIVRGTIVDVRETRVSLGGGEVPALHYTMEVDEHFKGPVRDVKGVPLTEFSVLGSRRKLDAHVPVIPGWPELRSGETYLLFIAPPGPSGLTVTMGIAQGCFAISGAATAGREETAVNGFDNVGLFRGMPRAGLPRRGPVGYRALADRIRAELGR